MQRKSSLEVRVKTLAAKGKALPCNLGSSVCWMSKETNRFSYVRESAL